MATSNSIIITTGGSVSLETLKNFCFPYPIGLDAYTFPFLMSTGASAHVSSAGTVQFLAAGTRFSRSQLYHRARLQDLDNFHLSFNLLATSAAADGICAFFGSGFPAPNLQHDPTSYGGAGFRFNIYTNPGRGVYFGCPANTLQDYSPNTTWMSGDWCPIDIYYTRGTTMSWVCNVSGSNVITTTLSNGNAWLTNTSGNYWGFSAFEGGLTANVFVSNVNLESTAMPTFPLYSNSNWHSMSFATISGTTSNTLSGDQMQLVTTTRGASTLYTSYPALSSNVANAKFNLIQSGSSGSFAYYFGASSANITPGYGSGINYQGGYAVEFWNYPATGSRVQGINYIDPSGTVLATAGGVATTAGTYNVNIRYVSHSFGTLKVSVNAATALVYSDPAFGTRGGDFWGMYAESASSASYSLSGVEIARTPRTIRLSDVYASTRGPASVSGLRGFPVADIESYTNLASNIAAYNGGPWRQSFIDTSAQYLWNDVSAASSEIPGIPINFQSMYTNTENHTIAATLYCVCDDIMYVYLNKLPLTVASTWVYTSTVPCDIILKPGRNVFDFVAYNLGATANPAGLIYSVRNTAGTLIRSDNATATPLANSTKTYVLCTHGSAYPIPWLANMCPLDATPFATTYLSSAYSTKLLTSTYTGPILKLRRSADNATLDFYADITGNLISSGTEASVWYSGGNAFVTTWYDQSGRGNHATQSNTALQPTLTYAYGIDQSLFSSCYCVDFYSVLGSLFQIPSNAIPVQPFSAAIKHGYVGRTDGNVYSTPDQSFRIGSNTSYIANGLTATCASVLMANKVVYSYDSTASNVYVNNSLARTGTGGTYATGGSQYIGPFAGQLFSILFYNTVLSGYDRTFVLDARSTF